MRPIEFRGKRVPDGEWVYGQLSIDDSDNAHFVGKWDEGRMVDPTTVGQSTGLLDKNGKKYWEDSIVQSEDGLRKYKVVWNKVKGGWSLKGIGKAWFVNDPEWRKYEVIGNVHEPEDK